MTAGINTMTVTAAAIDVDTAAVRDTILQRVFPSSFARVFEGVHSTDPLTCDLREWHQRFRSALAEAKDAGAVGYATRHFKDALKELLRDPLTDAPFEDEVSFGGEPGIWLGTDGIAYSGMTKRMIEHRYHNDLDNLYRHRSPLYPTREEPFRFIGSHPVAGKFMAWLLAKDPDFDRQRQAEWARAARLFDHKLRIRIQREEAREQNARAQEALEARVEQLVAARMAVVERALAPLDAQDEEHYAAIRAQIELNEQQEEEQTRVAHAAVDAMETEVEDLRAFEARMLAQIEANGVRLDQLDHRLSAINEQIIAIDKKIKERKKDVLKDVLITLAVIGAAWCVGYYFGLKAGLSAGTPILGVGIPI
jgi:hypothetical protein